MTTFPIYHPDHGTATCDDRMWAEFEAVGWSKTDPNPPAKPATAPAKPAKS